MTESIDPRSRRVPTPKFGATVTNNLAAERNPTRTGYFVKSGNNSGRMNPGPWWEITDGKGTFWRVRPVAEILIRQEDFPHLLVDRSTELP